MEAPNSSESFEPGDAPVNDLFEGLEDPGKPEKPQTSAAGPEKVFQCSCGKTYLSYSALYSHNKQKHNGAPMNLPSGRGGRTRGRPRKNGDIGGTRGKTRPTENRQGDAEMTEDDTFFRNKALMGGPVDPRRKYFPHSLHAESALHAPLNSLIMSSEGHNEETASCDEAFAAYLIAMGKRLSDAGMAMVTEFVEKLRDCVNEKGNELCGQSGAAVYCEGNTPVNLPEAANYFITEFLETSPASSFDRDASIDLMIHFSRWLFVKRYSNLKLSLCDKD